MDELTPRDEAQLEADEIAIEERGSWLAVSLECPECRRRIHVNARNLAMCFTCGGAFFAEYHNGRRLLVPKEVTDAERAAIIAAGKEKRRRTE